MPAEPSAKEFSACKEETVAPETGTALECHALVKPRSFVIVLSYVKLPVTAPLAIKEPPDFIFKEPPLSIVKFLTTAPVVASISKLVPDGIT